MFTHYNVLIKKGLALNARIRQLTEGALSKSIRARQLHFSGHRVPKESVACPFNPNQLIGLKSIDLKSPSLWRLDKCSPDAKNIYEVLL